MRRMRLAISPLGLPLAFSTQLLKLQLSGCARSPGSLAYQLRFYSCLYMPCYAQRLKVSRGILAIINLMSIYLVYMGTMSSAILFNSTARCCTLAGELNGLLSHSVLSHSSVGFHGYNSPTLPILISSNIFGLDSHPSFILLPWRSFRSAGSQRVALKAVDLFLSLSCH